MKNEAPGCLESVMLCHKSGHVEIRAGVHKDAGFGAVIYASEDTE